MSWSKKTLYSTLWFILFFTIIGTVIYHIEQEKSSLALIEVFVDDKKVKDFSQKDLIALSKSAVYTESNISGSILEVSDLLNQAGVKEGSKIYFYDTSGAISDFNWSDMNTTLGKLILTTTKNSSWKLLRMTEGGPLEGHILRSVKKIDVLHLDSSISHLDKGENTDCDMKVYSSFEETSKMPNEVCVLNLDRKNLKEFPKEILNLPNLVQLELGGNNLTTIPSSIANLKKIKYLKLGRNNIASIPPEIGQMKSLIRLELDHNNLSTLPSEIGELYDLNELMIEDNGLTYLPEEFSKLKNLKAMELEDNNFSEKEKEKIKAWFPKANLMW